MTSNATRPWIIRTRDGLALLALVALPSVPSAARADHNQQRTPPTTSRAVSVSDLDLATPAGLTAAEHRVTRMAQQLCHRLSDSRRIDGQQLDDECIAQARDQAWQRLLALVPSTQRVASSQATTR